LPQKAKKMKLNFLKTLIGTLVITLLLTACSKDNNGSQSEGPKLTLKTGAGYTSSSSTIGKAASFKVGIIAEKNTADLLVYLVRYSVDGGPEMSSFDTPITGTDRQRFEYDINLITRNQAGTEKWIFEVSDVNGKLTRKEITLTVQ
jgi:hypothetical protein